MNITKLLLSVSVVLSLSGFVVYASETENNTAHEGVEAHHKNKIEIGISNTHTEHGENAFTMALSYNYRFSDIASIGVLGEHAFGDLDTSIFGLPFKIYPGQGWVLTAMPAVERHGSHNEELFRLGVGYEFEMEGYSITPELNADYVDDEVNIVAGVSIGFGF